MPPPTVQQGLSYGFNSPKQALASMRTAFQGNLLDEEFRCFSIEWRDNNVNSINFYSEARDELMRRVPKLRWVLYRAEDPQVIARSDQDALLQCRIPGPLWFKDRYLVLHMHREGFWKGWTEGTPEKATEGNAMPDPIAAHVLEYVEKDDRYSLNVDEFSYWTDDTAPEAMTALHGGWQWKIQDINVYDEPISPEQFAGPVRLPIPMTSAVRQAEASVEKQPLID